MMSFLKLETSSFEVACKDWQDTKTNEHGPHGHLQ